MGFEPSQSFLSNHETHFFEHWRFFQERPLKFPLYKSDRADEHQFGRFFPE